MQSFLLITPLYLSGSIMPIASSDAAITLLFLTVVVVCGILLLITMLLYFMARASYSLWTIGFLAFAGLLSVTTSCMVLHQCIIQNNISPQNGFTICYIITGITMLTGLWITGVAFRRGKEILVDKGRHA